MPTPATRTLSINGKIRKVRVDDDGEDLLYVLRDQLDQHGPRFGCGVTQCGACTVLVDGTITRSCQAPLQTIPDGASIETLDGLAGPQSGGRLHPLQRTFIEQQAAQCAYCINGVIMGALGWLRQRKASGNTAVPSDAEITAFLSGDAPGSTDNYICRCGAHNRMVRAISAAAAEVLS